MHKIRKIIVTTGEKHLKQSSELCHVKLSSNASHTNMVDWSFVCLSQTHIAMFALKYLLSKWTSLFHSSLNVKEHIEHRKWYVGHRVFIYIIVS